MKFTSEDLMKAMRLAVGDRVKVALTPNHYAIFTLVNDENEGLSLISKEKEFYPVEFLVDLDFEILPRPKRVGDLKCDGKCLLCPCIYVCNEEVNAIDKTLYEVLELGIATFTKTPKKMNEEIHNVIKARLDREVVEEC